MGIPHLIITRPQPEADRWVHDLARLDCPATSLPLIELTPLDQPALDQARTQPQRWHALMFVSPAAVHAFLATRDSEAALQQATTRCLATGPGTRKALLAHGIDPARIDAPPAQSPQFDSESLWQVIAPRNWSGCRVLIVRGDGAETTPDGTGRGRDWLATQFRQSGAEVDLLAAYHRHPPAADPALIRQIDAARTDGSVWVFSSSQAVSHLTRLVPGADWSRTPCICTHERIARTTRASGFVSIRLCRPTPQDLAVLCHAQ